MSVSVERFDLAVMPSRLRASRGTIDRMSDAELRDLQRRWLLSGSPDDEAAYLLERVRVGALTQERLALSADAGHEGAIRAVRSPVPRRALEDVVLRLTEACRPAYLFGLLLASNDHALPRAVVLPLWEACARWMDDPTRDRAALCGLAGRAFLGATRTAGVRDAHPVLPIANAALAPSSSEAVGFRVHADLALHAAVSAGRGDVVRAGAILWLLRDPARSSLDLLSSAAG